jgi:hypothetical protein
MLEELKDYLWNHKGTIAPAVLSTLAALWAWWEARDTRRHSAKLENERRKFDSDMKVRERQFDFALQQAGFARQALFAQVAVKRIEALESFSKGFAELQGALLRLPKVDTYDTFKLAYADANHKFLKLWFGHTSQRIFLTERLCETINVVLHKIHALAINYETVHELKRDGEPWREFYLQEVDILQGIKNALQALNVEARSIWEMKQ